VSAGKGIEGLLEIFGIAIDRGEDVHNSLFDCKDVYITVVSEGLPTDFVKDAKSQEVFGWLEVLKDVRPLPRDYAAGDIPPIEANVEIDNDAFAAIAAQLASAEVRKVAANLTLRFGGPNVPPPADSRQEKWGVPLAKLDTQETRKYDLLSLGIGTGLRDWHFGRVPQSRLPLVAPRHTLAMNLVEARADIDFDTRLVRGIAASFVLRDHKSPINGSKVEVRWEEYDRDAASEDYPDLAEAGSFDARVPKVSADPSGCDLYLYLRYTQRDARDFLLPLLLNRPSGLAVEMDAVLIADARMMHAEPEGSTGQIAKYALRLSRTGA
jgi:hypothetical protein